MVNAVGPCYLWLIERPGSWTRTHIFIIHIGASVRRSLAVTSLGHSFYELLLNITACKGGRSERNVIGLTVAIESI